MPGVKTVAPMGRLRDRQLQKTIDAVSRGIARRLLQQNLPKGDMNGLLSLKIGPDFFE
jgi:hypothetical protein